MGSDQSQMKMSAIVPRVRGVSRSRFVFEGTERGKLDSTHSFHNNCKVVVSVLGMGLLHSHLMLICTVFRFRK